MIFKIHLHLGIVLVPNALAYLWRQSKKNSTNAPSEFFLKMWGNCQEARGLKHSTTLESGHGPDHSAKNTLSCFWDLSQLFVPLWLIQAQAAPLRFIFPTFKSCTISRWLPRLLAISERLLYLTQCHSLLRPWWTGRFFPFYFMA